LKYLEKNTPELIYTTKWRKNKYYKPDIQRTTHRHKFL